METEIRPGYYQDGNGIWHKDRRKKNTRREQKGFFGFPDRRTFYRRKTDREIMEREAQEAITDALSDLTGFPPEQPA